MFLVIRDSTLQFVVLALRLFILLLVSGVVKAIAVDEVVWHYW